MCSARREPPEHFMDLLLDAVCVVDRDGLFRFVSAAGKRIFGYAPEEMIGRPVLDFVHPDDRERTLGAIREILDGEPKHHFENRYLRKDGSTAHIMWSARWSEDDAVRIAVARDITERKQADALQNAVYGISEAVNGAGDLPTLLGAIDTVVRDLLPVTDCMVALRDPDTGAIRFPYPAEPDARGPASDPAFMQRLGTRVLEAGEAMLVTPDTAATVSGRTGTEAEARTPNHLAVPLESGNAVMGALVVRNEARDRPYTPGDRDRLGFVAVPIAAAIERANLHSRLTWMAQHDPLTGLPNRALFMDRLQSALARAHRDAGHLAVLYLDLDDFKRVNDTYGHIAGDRLLQEMARRLTDCVRGADTVGRLGGDEFVVLLDGIEHPDDGGLVARKIEAALQAPCVLDAATVHVRPSIGIAAYPQDGREADQLLRRADEAMYRTKRTTVDGRFPGAVGAAAVARHRSSALPALVGHADWSTSAAKRWIATASLRDGVYRVGAPEPVGDPGTLIESCIRDAHGGAALLGVDFPIGLPRAYARQAGIEDFRSALPALGTGRWRRFYDLAECPEQIAIERPFYPARPGGTRQAHLVDGLGVAAMEELLRACERGGKNRPRACPLFWTLGGKQVGRAAIAGWRHALVPALERMGGEVGLWPFDGDLDTLLRSRACVVAETYPADACVQLGLPMPGSGWSKRDRADRREQGRRVLAWAADKPIDLSAARDPVENGFGDTAAGEDAFDAWVGLVAMLGVVLGDSPADAPGDEETRRVEGWILGRRPG
jgi:diguanylate cyclase (GGDEF)-like protein/PAS domain S-box-containing protein